jgi:hypothetical protein
MKHFTISNRSQVVIKEKVAEENLVKIKYKRILQI